MASILSLEKLVEELQRLKAPSSCTQQLLSCCPVLSSCPATGQIVIHGVCKCPAGEVLNSARDACEAQYSTIMVVGGHGTIGNGGVDRTNNQLHSVMDATSCEMEDYPLALQGATGAILQNNEVVICGGKLFTHVDSTGYVDSLPQTYTTDFDAPSALTSPSGNGVIVQNYDRLYEYKCEVSTWTCFWTTLPKKLKQGVLDATLLALPPGTGCD